MILKSVLEMSCKVCLRNYSKSMPKPKLLVVPDDTVLNDISNEVYKPRKHPGIMKNKTVIIPDTLVKAATKVLEDYPVKAVLELGHKLSRHLKGRVPPMEKEEISQTVEKVQQKVLSKFKEVHIKNRDEENRYKQMITDRIDKILREKIYNWKPIKYDVMKCLAYLLERSPPEYAVLVKIFGEIEARDPNFIPRSLFDFGSGVGTATWAANVYWKKHIFEYFNVDISSDMNDLAQILLQGGKGNSPVIKGTFYRQFLPASNMEYDLVISAYSMLELPSLETRLETVLNLWNKTEKYLVIVEHGTNAGFKVVNEIRDFILQIDNNANASYVFSPCPHDNVCPRFLADDGTPCNFQAAYYSIPIGQRSELRKELYSYVVLQKGTRSSKDTQWPRIVRPTLVRSKHSICRVCTASGKLNEVIFTAKKHGKSTYHCARSSRWGDLLPVTLGVTTDENLVEDSGEEPCEEPSEKM